MNVCFAIKLLFSPVLVLVSLKNISILLLSVSDPEAEYIGTEPWKPKEALEEEGEITDKADIFAFGLTLWEMMTLAMPHLEMLEDDEEDEGEMLCGHRKL